MLELLPICSKCNEPLIFQYKENRPQVACVCLGIRAKFSILTNSTELHVRILNFLARKINKKCIFAIECEWNGNFSSNTNDNRFLWKKLAFSEEKVEAEFILKQETTFVMLNFGTLFIHASFNFFASS